MPSGLAVRFGRVTASIDALNEIAHVVGIDSPTHEQAPVPQDRSPNVAGVQPVQRRLGEAALADWWRRPVRERTLSVCVLDEPFEAAMAKGRELSLDLVGPGRSVRHHEELDRSRPVGLLEDRSPLQHRRGAVREVDADRFVVRAYGRGHAGHRGALRRQARRSA
jgi:hypothetical protein